MDEICPYPTGALPSAEAGPEVWAAFRTTYETNMAKANEQVAAVKQTVGKIQRLGQESNICSENMS